MYLVFTSMPGESNCRRLRSLLYLRYIFQPLINSLVCWFCLNNVLRDHHHVLQYNRSGHVAEPLIFALCMWICCKSIQLLIISSQTDNNFLIIEGCDLEWLNILHCTEVKYIFAKHIIMGVYSNSMFCYHKIHSLEVEHHTYFWWFEGIVCGELYC